MGEGFDSFDKKALTTFNRTTYQHNKEKIPSVNNPDKSQPKIDDLSTEISNLIYVRVPT